MKKGLTKTATRWANYAYRKFKPQTFVSIIVIAGVNTVLFGLAYVFNHSPMALFAALMSFNATLLSFERLGWISKMKQMEADLASEPVSDSVSN